MREGKKQEEKRRLSPFFNHCVYGIILLPPATTTMVFYSEVFTIPH